MLEYEICDHVVLCSSNANCQQHELLYLLNVFKGIDRRLRDFSNQYLTSMPNSEFVRMSKDIKEMQENQKKLQESQKKLQKSVEDAVRKFSELSRPMSQKRTVRPTAATSSAPQVMLTSIIVSVW